MRKIILLILILSSINLPVQAIKILKPGVKVNSMKLRNTMYLLSETEMASFTSWKIKNDFYLRELDRKDFEVKIYKDFNKELMKKFTTVSTSLLQTSDKLVQQLDGRQKDRRAGRRAARKAGLWGLLKGLVYGASLAAAKGAF